MQRRTDRRSLAGGDDHSKPYQGRRNRVVPDHPDNGACGARQKIGGILRMQGARDPYIGYGAEGADGDEQREPSPEPTALKPGVAISQGVVQPEIRENGDEGCQAAARR